MSDTTKPDKQFVDRFSINEKLVAVNKLDKNENPTGGHVILGVKRGDNEEFPALHVEWQDGPRGQEHTKDLLPPNGAFVEDVLWAARQRLEFFQNSKYASDYNQSAINHIDNALSALADRTAERRVRQVEGKHEV